MQAHKMVVCWVLTWAQRQLQMHLAAARLLRKLQHPQSPPWRCGALAPESGVLPSSPQLPSPPHCLAALLHQLLVSFRLRLLTELLQSSCWDSACTPVQVLTSH